MGQVRASVGGSSHELREVFWQTRQNRSEQDGEEEGVGREESTETEPRPEAGVRKSEQVRLKWQ